MNVRDAPSIGQSVQYVNQLVRDEIAAGTPADRIVIGGFSQVCRPHQRHARHLQPLKPSADPQAKA